MSLQSPHHPSQTLPEAPAAAGIDPSKVLVVDGTRKECAGIIAGLEKAMGGLHEGSLVRAIVDDVPSRLEVHLWAERKGHAVVKDEIVGEFFHITVIKGGAAAGAGKR
jgi:TusA-related sulfurtransferase